MAVTRLEAGSTRESDRPPRFATQTAPAPAATATGSSPTEIAFETVLLSGSIRETESSPRFATQTPSPLTATAAGSRPTLTARINSQPAGSRRRTTFASLSTAHTASPLAATATGGLGSGLNHVSGASQGPGSKSNRARPAGEIVPVHTERPWAARRQPPIGVSGIARSDRRGRSSSTMSSWDGSLPPYCEVRAGGRYARDRRALTLSTARIPSSTCPGSEQYTV